MGRWEEIEVFVTAPEVNGATLTPRTPLGCRCAATTTTVTHIRLDNDVLLQQPDTGGNAAGVAMLGYNMLRVYADGDALCVLFDATGALVPDPAANGTAASCEIIPNGQYMDYMVIPSRHAFLNIRSRASAAQVRYRLSAPVAGNR